MPPIQTPSLVVPRCTYFGPFYTAFGITHVIINRLLGKHVCASEGFPSKSQVSGKVIGVSCSTHPYLPDTLEVDSKGHTCAVRVNLSRDGLCIEFPEAGDNRDAQEVVFDPSKAILHYAGLIVGPRFQVGRRYDQYTLDNLDKVPNTPTRQNVLCIEVDEFGSPRFEPSLDPRPNYGTAYNPTLIATPQYYIPKD